MPEEFDFWKLIAGLGIFLFGMFLMEESVRKLSGRSFRRLIRDYTRGRFRSIASGVFTTGLLQSSSAISLMVLAFVGAGVMDMTSAIGVIMGSNLGTTLTGWIVATLGFSFKIESFALPLIGIGGLGLIFLGKSEKYSNISKLMVGFGFLFLGLDYMKGGVEALASQFDLSTFRDYNIFVFVGLGFIFTVLMQSSSATLAIVLTTLHAGVIDFHSGAGLVIGANIGTTFTIILGAMGAAQVKKRVALSHFLFNVVTAVVALALVYPLSWLIEDVFGLKDNPMMGVALFHTFFNLMGILIFFPIMGLFAKILLKIFPDRHKTLALYISGVNPSVPDAAVPALKSEILHLIKRTLVHNLVFLRIDPRLVFSPNFLPKLSLEPEKIKVQELLDSLQQLQSEVFSFAAEAQNGNLQADESEEINGLLHGARLAVYSARTLQDIAEEFNALEGSDSLVFSEMEQHFRKRVVESYLGISRLLEKAGPVPAEQLGVLKQQAREEDRDFVARATRLVGEKSLESDRLPALLMINRAIYESLKQAVNGLGEVYDGSGGKEAGSAMG
ncbi:MAG: Na/Pi cotransporter family protein [Bacteroidia bacterium]|nr:Na/Pi cotransporter family protein [Bacteroidia bacterium]